MRFVLALALLLAPVSAWAQSHPGPGIAGINSAGSFTSTGWASVGVSPIVGLVGTIEDQGYSTDGKTYSYVFGQDATSKYNRSAWLPPNQSAPTDILTNSSVLSVVPGANHQGSGSDPYQDPTYGQVVLSPLETYTNPTTFSNQHIVLWKTSDLTSAKVIDVSAAGTEASGVAIAPGLGNSGGDAIVVSNYGASSVTIQIYDYASSVSTGTGQLVRSLSVGSSITSAQSVRYYNGMFYILANTSGGVQTVFSVDPTTGAATAVVSLPMYTATESITFDNGQLAVFISDVTSSSSWRFVHYYSVPSVASPVISISLTNDGTPVLGARVPPIIGGLTIGDEFWTLTPPNNGLRVQGQTSIGCLSADDLGMLNVCAKPFGNGGSGAVLRLLSYGETTNANGGLAATGSSWGYGTGWSALYVGNPTSANMRIGVDTNTHIRITGNLPTTSTSGASLVTGSTNALGTINVPSAATSVNLTFNQARNWEVTPACVANLNTASAVGVVETTTGVTFSFSALGSAGTLRYFCAEAK